MNTSFASTANQQNVLPKNSALSDGTKRLAEHLLVEVCKDLDTNQLHTARDHLFSYLLGIKPQPLSRFMYTLDYTVTNSFASQQSLLVFTKKIECNCLNTKFGQLPLDQSIQQALLAQKFEGILKSSQVRREGHEKQGLKKLLKELKELNRQIQEKLSVKHHLSSEKEILLNSNEFLKMEQQEARVQALIRRGNITTRCMEQAIRRTPIFEQQQQILAKAVSQRQEIIQQAYIQAEDIINLTKSRLLLIEKNLIENAQDHARNIIDLAQTQADWIRQQARKRNREEINILELQNSSQQRCCELQRQRPNRQQIRHEINLPDTYLLLIPLTYI